MATGFRDRRVHDIAVVRLTHKYAEMIDDVDLSGCQVGEMLALSAHDASLLIAEGWAERIAERRMTHQPAGRAAAADSVEPAARRTGEPESERITSENGVARPTKPRQDL